MFLVSVYFDDHSSKTLQRYIDSVADITDNRFMTNHKVPPHLTLAAIEARNADSLIPVLEQIEGELISDKVQIVSTGMLLPYVLYVTPVLNRYLQTLQTTVYDAFSKIPEVRINKYYDKSQWFPHITIGKQLTRQQMMLGVDTMIGKFVPMEAVVVKLALSSVNPHRDLVWVELK